MGCNLRGGKESDMTERLTHREEYKIAQLVNSILVLQKIKVQLPSDSAFPLPRIHHQKLKVGS